MVGLTHRTRKRSRPPAEIRSGQVCTAALGDEELLKEHLHVNDVLSRARRRDRDH